ncbi:MAG TPA: aminotransferase class III-fold pyridoxal phosphate-dependent enzyme, partial [Longimicrobium sp.]|nr:aminotransferase class III-fold pyridoxal phosphate-dependent enzyme [Longimicrobium sp.]
MQDRENEIAIIGMSCRFPGARDTTEYWANLRDGVESVSFFSEDELLAAGTAPEVLGDPSFVRAHGSIDGAHAFDAAFFGVNAREAQVMDPQQRVFLECSWSALEDAGYDPARFPGAIGVYAGSGATWYLWRVLKHADLVEAVGTDVARFANDRDFLTTRVSYKLGLRGPSVAVQTACSTSLVAVHLACQGLLARECDLALSGGVTISPDQAVGYAYQEGGILSPDGHCRAFDARAAGTVSGSGAGVVVLKRMVDALRDGDTIHAVIRGSATNNDGAAKIGFTAPSARGQAQVIAEALAVAGVNPAEVSYVETHGTGTPLGDPIEIAALAEVFGGAGVGRGACALGAVKTNLGHLDTAAGVAGLIKTVLALKHGAIPPTLHFEKANPETGLDDSPFHVNAALTAWERGAAPRRAGVSSFGMGGTNAHVVLEEAPEVPPAPASDRAQLLVLSAKTGHALERIRRGLGDHLAARPDLSLADVAHTLQVGRAEHPHRWAAVARGALKAGDALAGIAARPPATREAAERAPAVAFLFPGQGTQYAGMARELYECEPVFRREIDRCADALADGLGMDLRTALFPAEDGEQAANARLGQTRYTQPALFAVEYALARLWMSWGVTPGAMLGHSIGEYVAACLAGVFTVEAALVLVEARGRMMQALPGGAMLAVPLPEAELRPILPERLSLAAVNGAASCVVSGDTADVDAMEAALAAGGVEARRLHTSHAFHSAAMDPILDAFTAAVRRARPAPPAIPFLSNVTGDWITAEQATDPGYWVRHLRETVRFDDGVGRLLEEPDRVLVEVGPGETLGTFARRHASGGGGRTIVNSVPRADRPDASDLTILEAAATLWTAGVEIDWASLRGDEPRRRVPLPTYPFARTEHRLPPHPRASAPPPASAPAPASEPPPASAAAPSVPAADRASRIAGGVTELFARLLGTPAAELATTRTFLELGADSLLLMQASRTIEGSFGVKVPFRKLLEGISTIGELSAHLDRQVPPDAVPDPMSIPPLERAAGDEPPAAGALDLREIVAQQLAIMREQLVLLRGVPHPAGDDRPAATTAGNGRSTETTQATGNGRRVDPLAAPAAPLVRTGFVHPVDTIDTAAAVATLAVAPVSPTGNERHVETGAASAVAVASAGSGQGPETPAPALAAGGRMSAVPAAAVERPASHGPHRPVRQTMGQGGGFTERQARHFGALVERYTARTRRSREYAAENRPVLADNRASLNFRMATKELLYPVVGERSQGSRLWDVDGNEYIDFTIGFGVHFFGHRPAFIVEAVEEQLRRGFHLGPQSDLAGPAARMIRELTGVERVTFCNTGSEAVMTALRIARTVTGRDRVVLFEGSYHGCFDGILARSAGGGAGPGARPVAPGTPQGMVDDVVILPYGKPETLRWIEEHAGEIAAVLAEPVQSRRPEFHPRDFLRELRALTERTGVVLIFDEMISGLRLEARGAQGFLGIDADLVTYGKVIGGGFPLGVVAGRARLMDAIDGGQWSYGDASFPAADQTFFAGTFCKHPVVMAAACAALRHLQARGPALYDELNARAARLVEALRRLLDEEEVPIFVIGCGSLFQFGYRTENPFIDLLFYHMVERGIYVWEGRACFLSTAHTDEDCDRFVEAFRESVHALREGGFLPERSGPGGGPPPAGGAGGAGGPAVAALPAGLKLFPAPERPSAGVPRPFPLTPAQRQVWVHAQLGDDASRA